MYIWARKLQMKFKFLTRPVTLLFKPCWKRHELIENNYTRKQVNAHGFH